MDTQILKQVCFLRTEIPLAIRLYKHEYIIEMMRQYFSVRNGVINAQSITSTNPAFQFKADVQHVKMADMVITEVSAGSTELGFLLGCASNQPTAKPIYVLCHENARKNVTFILTGNPQIPEGAVFYWKNTDSLKVQIAKIAALEKNLGVLNYADVQEDISVDLWRFMHANHLFTARHLICKLRISTIEQSSMYDEFIVYTEKHGLFELLPKALQKQSVK